MLVWREDFLQTLPLEQKRRQERGGSLAAQDVPGGHPHPLLALYPLPRTNRLRSHDLQLAADFLDLLMLSDPKRTRRRLLHRCAAGSDCLLRTENLGHRRTLR